MSQITTLAPDWRKAVAMARPRPPAPPVMIAVLPWRVVVVMAMVRRVEGVC